MDNQQAIIQLNEAGIINDKTFEKLLKRIFTLQKKEAWAERQTRVNGAVAFAVGTLLKENTAIQHRAVWNLVGRENAVRDEILDGLRALRDTGALTSFKKSGNNFQVFWSLPVPDVDEAATEAVANEMI
mgnify:CR=1 FL=1